MTITPKIHDIYHARGAEINEHECKYLIGDKRHLQKKSEEIDFDE